MKKTIYHRNGIAVELEMKGKTPGFGNFIHSYRLTDGQVLRSWYGDNTCPNDVFGEPVPDEQVPEEAAGILGNPIGTLQQRLSKAYEFEELKN